MYLECKKIKGHFRLPSDPIPFHPTPSNSGKALALRFEHWTQRGDCKVTGNKERNKKMNRTKKS